MMNCSRKTLRCMAQEQNQDLRDAYLFETATILPEQFVFVDESGCDRRTSQRTKGWAPRGQTPLKRGCFQRGQRYQILPAYSCDGVLAVDIFLGSTNASTFENFISKAGVYVAQYSASLSHLSTQCRNGRRKGMWLS